MKVLALICVLSALAGCSALPRDPDGTLDRVRDSGMMKVGIVETPGAALPAPARALLARLSAATGAKPQLMPGAAEPLLMALEAGKLDLVVGNFAHDTPWTQRVALSPPLAVRGAKEMRIDLIAAMPPGENRWIMLVENSVRAVAPTAAAQ